MKINVEMKELLLINGNTKKSNTKGIKDMEE